MAISIDRKLNLVVPVETDAGQVFVHSTPIARAVFERYYDVIARTFAAILANYGPIIGPRVAALTLRAEAERTNSWEDRRVDDGGVDRRVIPGVRNGLVSEIERLTNVLAPGSNGWEITAFADAVSAGKMSEEDATEVSNIITFFIVVSAMILKDRKKSLSGMCSMWDGQITSLACTEYLASLRTSTPADNIGERPKPTRSSIPV